MQGDALLRLAGVAHFVVAHLVVHVRDGAGTVRDVRRFDESLTGVRVRIPRLGDLSSKHLTGKFPRY